MVPSTFQGRGWTGDTRIFKHMLGLLYIPRFTLFGQDQLPLPRSSQAVDLAIILNPDLVPAPGQIVKGNDLRQSLSSG